MKNNYIKAIAILASIICFCTINYLIRLSGLNHDDYDFIMTILFTINLMLSYRVYNSIYYKKLIGDLSKKANVEFFCWLLGLIIFIPIGLVFNILDNYFGAGFIRLILIVPILFVILILGAFCIFIRNKILDKMNIKY